MLAGAEIVPGSDAEIVASHCTKDLSWLQPSIDSLENLGTKVVGVHIYSKCGLAPIGAPAGAHPTPLPPGCGNPPAPGFRSKCRWT